MAWTAAFALPFHLQLLEVDESFKLHLTECIENEGWMRAKVKVIEYGAFRQREGVK